MSDLLTLNGLLSNTHAMATMPSELKLLVNITSAEVKGPRPALDVALVVDRSTSMMEQEKLDKVRTAANYMLQRLTPQDMISIVDFGSDVNVLLPSQAANDPMALGASLQKLQAKGATNLHGAIQVGGQEVQKGAGGGRLQRILLLSDGVATEGITTDEPILQMADQMRQGGTSISTLGVGSDYDEVLMSGISERSGGNHYYIANPDEIASIFAEEMDRLEAVVAKQLKLRLTVEQNFPVKLLNRRYPCQEAPGQLEVSLNDMQKGKSQPVIFGLSLPALPEGDVKVATATLTYEEAANPGTIKTAQADVVVHIVSDPGLIRTNINREVLRQWEELDAVQSVAEIVEKVEAGRMDAATAVGEIDKRGMTLVKRGSARAEDVIQIGKTIARSGGVTPEVKKSTIAYRARVQQGQS